jgi:hypothetical protein
LAGADADADADADAHSDADAVAVAVVVLACGVLGRPGAWVLGCWGARVLVLVLVLVLVIACCWFVLLLLHNPGAAGNDGNLSAFKWEQVYVWISLDLRCLCWQPLVRGARQPASIATVFADSLVARLPGCCLVASLSACCLVSRSPCWSICLSRQRIARGPSLSG